MPLFLRQSTASQEVPLGYFVASDDGDTAETGLTINASDIKIWKTGATALAEKNSGGATHIAGGIYYGVLDATDTNTIGPLVIFVHVSGALAVRVECCVLDEAVYDVLFGTVALTTGGAITVTSGRVNADLTHIATAAVSTSTAQLGVNAVQAGGTAWGSGAITNGSIANDAFTASKFHADVTTELQSGLATAAALTTLTDRVGTPSDLGGGATVAANLATIEAQTDDIGAAGAGLSAVPWNAAWDAEVQSECADALSAYGAATSTHVSAVETDTQDIQARLPAALVGGRIDSNMGAISSDATAADNLEAALDGTGSVTITAALTGNITGNVSGSVSSVSGSVGSVAAGGISASSFAAGAIDATAIATDAIGANELAASAVSEIQSGLSTLDASGVRTAVGLAAANLDTQIATLNALIDTEVAAIKTKTDQLTFTSANKVDATLQAAADLATAVGQKVADIVLRRLAANIEASANGDTLGTSSLYGVLMRAEKSDTTTHVGKMTVFKTDGTTELGQIDITVDDTAQDITGFG